MIMIISHFSYCDHLPNNSHKTVSLQLEPLALSYFVNDSASNFQKPHRRTKHSMFVSINTHNLVNSQLELMERFMQYDGHYRDIV